MKKLTMFFVLMLCLIPAMAFAGTAETAALLWANALDILAVLGSIVLLASAITAGTRTPDPDSALGKIYRLIEVCALVVGRAKDTGKE
jgi:hypothetical protein